MSDSAQVDEKSPTKQNAVLVIGAGIGGIRAAFDLADSGYQVYLVDRTPAIGGAISQLDNQFPSNHCGMCRLLPTLARDEAVQFCLRRELVHPLISVLTQTEVVGLSGQAGDFTARVRKTRRLLDESRCIGCGICAEVCPVEVPDSFNEGLTKRKAAYLKLPTAVPRLYTIDPEHCTRCGICVEPCPTKAIDLKEGEETRDLAVGSVILSPGFEEFEARTWGQYGHGRFANVVTSIEFERLFSGSGPEGGRLRRPSDHIAPRRIAFLQCVGSRDKERDYCSAACCMFALKEAMIAKEIDPGVEARIFFMDLRAFGKGYYRYHQDASSRLGVKFSRCRVSSVKEHPKTKNLTVIGQTEDGKFITEEFDLVVLSIGLVPPPLSKDLAQTLGISLDAHGFCQGNGFFPVTTSREGVYTCGAFGGPKDIPETVTEAQAAALRASTYVAPRQTKARDPRGEEDIRTGVFLCRCGGVIEKGMDIGALKEFCRTLPSVAAVQDVFTLCLPEGLSRLRESVTSEKLTRIVIGACAPYSYEVLFRRTLEDGGVEGAFVEIADLREELLWVHSEEQAKATQKAQSILATATAKVRTHAPQLRAREKVEPAVLVIGGGLAGLTAARALSERGAKVHLVERSAELGGNLRDVPRLIDGKNPQVLLEDLVAKVTADPGIELYLNSEVVESSGYAGHFRSVVAGKGSPDSRVEISHGSTIVATGALECRPEEFGYGQDPWIVTQRQLSQGLANGQIQSAKLNSVVMIQCVGSRDEKHPYCSRTCCTQAIANALQIKERSPQNEVFVLYQEMMAYGLLEEYYTRAREKGVVFLRYEEDRKPEVRVKDGNLEVEVIDPVLGSTVLLNPDLIALSAGVVPVGNDRLAEVLHVELSEDGFFGEADTKFRPVDFQREGIYVCGLAHSPRSVNETIAQAEAAAQRALSLATKERLESRRFVAEVNERRCSACELCIAACVYDARVRDTDKNIVAVREVLCQGCGACTMICPNDAVKLRGLMDKQVFQMLDAAIGSG